MKCRYFCRLPLDISPVYLTRGISKTPEAAFFTEWTQLFGILSAEQADAPDTAANEKRGHNMGYGYDPEETTGQEHMDDTAPESGGQ